MAIEVTNSNNTMRCRVNASTMNVPVKFLMDTGSLGTVITPEVARIVWPQEYWTKP